MKYPQSVPMTRDVEGWLQSELEARGIDAAVYSRHILPLLQPHHPPKGVWSSRMLEGSGVDFWRFWDDEALKRLNVVRCLMSSSDQKCDIGILMDELCSKLQEIQCGASDADNVFPKCDYTPPYAADLFDCGLAPSREGLERGGETLPPIGWTRGLLHASLNHTNPGLFYDDTINIEDCYSMMHCGQKKSLGHVGSLFPAYSRDEDVKRLYERVAVTCINDTAPPAQVDTNLYDCFFNSNFSPSFYAFAGAADEKSHVSWSLGGIFTSINDHSQLNCATATLANPPVPQPHDPPVQPPEEDLLTSARTHFRPIRIEEPPKLSKYADGTTFVISTELDDPPFERSESGTLFLNNGKYMEFKKEDDIRQDEFIPKFRIRQSNEKFCQTDDMSCVSEERVVPALSPDSSDAEFDAFYFPGDDELAEDLDNDDLPAEEEIIQIVSGRWQGVGDVLDGALESPDPELIRITELDQGWGSDDVGAHANTSNIEQEGIMESAMSDSSTEKPAWPNLISSIWDNTNSRYSCDGCKGETADNLMAKKEWQEIWGAPLCAECNSEKVTKLTTTSVQVENDIIGLEHDSLIKKKSPLFADSNKVAESCFTTIWSPCAPATVDEANEGRDVFDMRSFEPYSSQDKKLDVWNSSDSADTGKWPRLGAFTAFLEEKRARAFEMFPKPVWSPIHTADDEGFGQKPRVLREIWSPINSSDDDGWPILEWRDIWSPVRPSLHIARAATYSMLRDELSEDGDQLLSDLSCLHLQQLNSGDSTDADDSFPSAPPSPECEQSCCFVGLDTNWSWEHGQDNQTLNERSYNKETAQKERKRRNSSSQKLCELYLDGGCRRPHCRFLHCDAAVPCPFFDDASCLKGDACPLFHAPRAARELHRAFTL